jgi:hypothetical protein
MRDSMSQVEGGRTNEQLKHRPLNAIKLSGLMLTFKNSSGGLETPLLPELHLQAPVFSRSRLLSYPPPLITIGTTGCVRLDFNSSTIRWSVLRRRTPAQPVAYDRR